ncbi:MAG: DUF255 domain-containing protein, partial [Pseudomonadota bacterium]
MNKFLKSICCDLIVLASLLAFSQIVLANDAAIKVQHRNANGEPTYTNRLASESSLYLLQHAHNPVDWHPWGVEAFAQAKKAGKPVFLSIGYSTCHWCHVMASESFENVAIAKFINEHFVPIKVDKEEHPDIDELYLTAVELLTGKAGWPLTAVLTPEGKPFFGGTYFSPQDLGKALTRVTDVWQSQPEAIEEQANRVQKTISKQQTISKQTLALTADFFTAQANTIATSLLSRSQTGAGFPREPELLYLLEYSRHESNPAVMQALEEHLRLLAASGINDHAGGGFHRYAVDAGFEIPHFEKMLYNQAQLASAYAQFYQLTGKEFASIAAKQTYEFALTQMQDPQGGFYSAMDAQSKDARGQLAEGAYYLWTSSQLQAALAPQQIETFEQ